MDVDQLIAFDRIVREGSFSRAAWELHIAQPTISARIQALEQEVGGPLFARSSRKISLTALGTSFLPYARRAIEVLAEGAAAAREAQDGQRGRLTIGVLGSLAGCLLAPALAQFQRGHPHVECYVRAGSHQRMVELLCDGVVELGLIAWPCIDPLSVELTPLLKLSEPVVLVVPARHPLAQQLSVTQQDVADQAAPLLLVRWWQSTHAGVARIAARARSGGECAAGNRAPNAAGRCRHRLLHSHADRRCAGDWAAARGADRRSGADHARKRAGAAGAPEGHISGGNRVHRRGAARWRRNREYWLSHNYLVFFFFRRLFFAPERKITS